MTRYVFSTAMALLVTFALFWTMQALITVGYKLLDGGEQLSVEFVRLRRDTTPQATKRPPPKREKPKQAPPPPQIRASRSNLDPGEGVAQIAPDIDASAGVEAAIAGGGSDRGAVPLVQPEPEYPIALEQRGITGWVTVEFWVTKTGSVRDPVIIAARPKRVFNQAALKGVRRWKYNPKIVNGEPIETKERFTLEFRP
ncbi:MAG: energy transducer TonB [Myxococcota bacterium]